MQNMIQSNYVYVLDTNLNLRIIMLNIIQLGESDTPLHLYRSENYY